jgi:tagaturonate reductase
MNHQNLFHGGITMVKLTPRGDLSQFSEVNGKYDLTTKGLLNGNVVDNIEQIDVYQRFVHPYIEWVSFLNTAEEEDLNIIVSNSTEAGICYKQCPFPNVCPETYPAKLCAWLFTRFSFFGDDQKHAPLVLPMELIENNGSTLREIILKHAEDWQLNPEFSKWIKETCDFRNTLVDRIVTKGDKLEVNVEPYHLFAVEGKDPGDKLPLTEAGINVFWTENLAAFRETKVRMLNGGHTSFIYAAILSREEIVADALDKVPLNKFLRSVLLDEILPTLEAKGGNTEELKNYAEAVIERFRNPFLNHKMINIALNSSSKLLVRIMPSFNDLYKSSGQLPEKLTQSIAAFLWFYRGVVEGDLFKGCSDGFEYEFSDDLQAMNAMSTCDNSSPGSFAKSACSKTIWKGQLSNIPELEESLTHYFTEFQKQGLKKTLFPEL